MSPVVFQSRQSFGFISSSLGPLFQPLFGVTVFIVYLDFSHLIFYHSLIPR